MAHRHVSALALGLLVCGCGPEPEPDTVVPVRVHLAPGCGAGDPLTVQLEALGDFDASPTTSESLPGSGAGVPLAFPELTLAIEARGAGASGSYLGVAALTAQDRVDVLLWPQREACELWRPSGQSPYPTQGGGEALGVSRDGRTLLVAGGLVASADAARAVRVDLDVGTASEVPDGMLPARAFATVTQLGDDAMLVAGGVDPSSSGGDLDLSPPVGSASVFELSTGRFDRTTLVVLSQPRARHGATVLRDGATLLVGGRGATGLALSTVELISPEDRAARVAGLATLRRPRISPTVFTLDDGRVFVGAGVGSVGEPVGHVEWLAPDAGSVVLERGGFVLSDAPAFAPLVGGGVLGVGVCMPSPTDDCATELERRVLRLGSDGRVDVLPLLPPGATAPVLLPAANGSPWLIAGPVASRVARRFNPWGGTFAVPPDRPTRLPDGTLGAFALDPRSFVWLERDATTTTVQGFRHDLRGEYSRQVAPLLLAGVEHVAPTRQPDAELRYDVDGLQLDGDDAAVWVTDVTFQDVTIEVSLAAGVAPLLLLGDEAVGGQSCPWPASDALPAVLRARRSGSEVTLERDGQVTRCVLPEGRIRVGLAASGGQSVVRALSLSRS